jgi:hypothetical protein
MTPKFSLRGFSLAKHYLPMSKTLSRTACLQEMIKLEERKGALEKQLAEIQNKLHTLTRELLGNSSGALAGQTSTTPAARTRRNSSSSGRGPRGSVTAQILKELKEAGPKGVSVADLAKKLNRKYGNIYVWFSTTAKNKFPKIEKLDKGRFRLNE